MPLLSFQFVSSIFSLGFDFSLLCFLLGMGNASTRKDGVEGCEDFDQYMKLCPGGTHGMGNPHGGRNGEGPSGVKKFEACHQHMDSAHVKGDVNHGENAEGTSGVKRLEEGHQCMDFSLYSSHVMTPSHNTGSSLRAVMLPPKIHGYAQVGCSTENEDMLHGMLVRVPIRWSYGGKQVAVEGSWDNWQSKELLPGSGKEFSITKVLPLGIYHLRFIVDGQWRNTPELPLVYDHTGCAYNVLDLKNYVPGDPESPSSPESSYNSRNLVAQDFEKEPPELPPQAEITPLNGPSLSMDSSQSLTSPQTIVLNHLYIQRVNQNAVALGSTHRFRTKYITVVLYKPCRG